MKEARTRKSEPIRRDSIKTDQNPAKQKVHRISVTEEEKRRAMGGGLDIELGVELGMGSSHNDKSGSQQSIYGSDMLD